jgi:hypothetical protein
MGMGLRDLKTSVKQGFTPSLAERLAQEEFPSFIRELWEKDFNPDEQLQLELASGQQRFHIHHRFLMGQ